MDQTGVNVKLPDELRDVPPEVLEGYVQRRISLFMSQACTLFATSDLAGTAAPSSPESSAGTEGAEEQCALRFEHVCKFQGCTSKACTLCINNPTKRCGDHATFADCCADSQVLRSPCNADVSVQMVSLSTGQPVALYGAEVQLSIVDGEDVGQFNKLLHSDEGQPLLGAHLTTTQRDTQGRLLLPFAPVPSSSRLPELYMTAKNPFQARGSKYVSFRLLATAIERDADGNAVPLACVQPAVSCRFVIKTQRTLNDSRKPEYPHHHDDITKLKFIGDKSVERLRCIQAHMPDVPFQSVKTVGELHNLMLHVDQSFKTEAILLELLNMKKPSWDYLRSVL
ncbi:hypothetical protein FOA52_007843 [Chlamydomonas sp. UWO 241]|nr:hypothetical protein FOA52_007843 [Chlamydomonas sp. UWO 241]